MGRLPRAGPAVGCRQPPSGHLYSAFSGAPHRLLRSLVSLKQVIINAAHYLVLGDKETYEFDPGTPFFQMVSPSYICLRDLVVWVVLPQELRLVGTVPLFPSLFWGADSMLKVVDGLDRLGWGGG